MKTNDKKSKDSSTKYGKRNKKMEVVLYNKKSNHQKGPTLKERLEKIAKNSLKQGQILSKEAFRRAKVVRSSAFESMLLKATWPNNDPVQPEILNEIIKYSIPAFKFSSVDSEDDPYYMTMHKLWTKMCEKDWRTISKSLYILHTITRDCQSEACERFSEAIKDMVKTRNPKKPDHRYFDAKKLTELDDNSVEYEEYTQAYAAYVIQRAKSFTSKFEEIDLIDNETSEKKVLSILKKAQQCIKLALQVEVHDKKLYNPITGYSTKLIALDLIDMWRLIGEKIAVFLDAKTYANPQSSHTQTIADLLQFYKDTEQKITKYLGTNSKLYSKLKIKIPNQLEKNTAVTSDTLTARISQLTSISGGYINSNDISINRVNKLLMNVDDRERMFIHKYSINNDDDDEEEDEEEADEEGEDSNDDDEDNETNENEDSDISHDDNQNNDEDENQDEDDDEEEAVDDEECEEEVEEIAEADEDEAADDDDDDVAIDNDDNEQEEDDEEEGDTNNDDEEENKDNEEVDDKDDDEVIDDNNDDEVNDDNNDDEVNEDNNDEAEDDEEDS